MPNFGEQPTSTNRDRISGNEEGAEEIKKKLAEAMASEDYDKVAELGGQMKSLKGQKEEFIDKDRDEADAENAERKEYDEAKNEDAERTAAKEAEKIEAERVAKELEEMKLKDGEETAKKIEEVRKQINGGEAGAAEQSPVIAEEDHRFDALRDKFANIENKRADNEAQNEKKLLEKSPNQLTDTEIQSLSVDALKNLNTKHAFGEFGKKLDSTFKGEVGKFSDLYKGKKSMRFDEAVKVLANVSQLGEVFSKIGPKAKEQLSEQFAKSLELNNKEKDPLASFYLATGGGDGRSMELLIKSGIVSKEVIVNNLKEMIASSSYTNPVQMGGTIVESFLKKGILSSDEAVALIKEMTDKKKVS